MTTFGPASTWIGMDADLRGRAAPLFRREFVLPGPVASATLKVCGLGFYEAWLNGRRVGDQVLDPAQTDYEKRVFYVTHEVTALLHPGANAIGVMLGDGWYNQDRVWGDPNRSFYVGRVHYGEPCLLAELELVMADGSTRVIGSDETWACAPGPVTESNLYAGEHYDARRELPGWAAAGFADPAWHPVACVPAPGGRLERQAMPPIRKIEELRPVSISEPVPKHYVCDFGQNFAGWVRLQVTAPAGTAIQLRFAETVTADGGLDTASTGVFATHVEQTDRYICNGQGVETWEPRFTYHGFRYVEITGWPGVPGTGAVTGVAVHTDLPVAGEFICSDARLNQLHRMALWTHRSNIHSIPEDCPARERCGWLGDANVVAEYSLWNFHGRAFWEKYLDDIETSRELNGGLPTFIAPGKRTCGTATTDWMAAFVLLPWYLHLHGGDLQLFERHWDGMCAALEHMRAKADGWITDDGLGDWCDPGTSCAPTYTPKALTTTLWFGECARVMATVAARLGHTAAADRYAAWTTAIRSAFQARFYDASNHTFGSQAANVLALHFRQVPAGQEAEVAASLVRDIRETHALHHTVGIMGMRYLFEVLTRHGHGDTALALLHQDSYPSFGELIRRGATTLWEYWGEPEVDQAEGPRSLNHPMMGGFDNWFYNTLAGIRPDPEQPGFRHFFLEPHPIPGLEWVRAYHDAPPGRIRSEWRLADGQFRWEIEIPAGGTATARLPFSCEHRTLGPGRHQIEESGDR
jgi:alpha-L-rhamnosidase